MFNFLKRKEVYFSALIFILAALPFVFNLRDFFLSDDWDFLTQAANPTQPLWRYFFTNYVGTHLGGSYRPLVVFFWDGLYHFFGLNYFWYHLAQIFFQAGCAVLLFWVVLNFDFKDQEEKRFSCAAASAVIFALLPNHAEAVAWLAAIADPLCVFFYLAGLLALLLCLKFSRAKFWLYSISLIFFFTALLAKEMAMSWPFVVFVFAVFYAWRKKIKPLAILWTAPYFALLAFYFYLRYRAIGIFFGYYGAEHLSFSFMKTAASYVNLAVSFVLSDNWRVIFSFWLNDNLAVVLIFSILILSGLFFLSWKKKAAIWAWPVFLALGLSLVPVAGFGLDLSRTYFSEEGERYGYLPSLFFSFLLGAAMLELFKKYQNNFKKKIIFFAMAGFLALGLGGQLLIKNWRYHRAGELARRSLFSAAEIMEKEKFIGVLFFGLPDDFHGAPIFRNGWQQSIAFYLKDRPIILSPFNRTAYESGQKFAVEKKSGNAYNYASARKARFILAKPKFSSADYQTELKDFSFEPQGINNRYFGSRLDIVISDNLARQEKIGLFFWDGGQWQVLTANNL